jgi:hypothetical protein
MFKQLFFLAIVGGVFATVDDIPELSENQKRALDQFADHKVFAEAWKNAAADLHRRYREIHDKAHHNKHRHRKIRKVVYVDDPDDRYD